MVFEMASLVFWFSIKENSVRIQCKPLNIDITENTLGQAVKRLGNTLKRKKVIELEKALKERTK